MDWQLVFKLYVFQTVMFGFLFAFGACLGSLVNVLVYRLPLGMGVVTPPSRCTSCGTRLTWKENFPVFGWLRLGGKCRFCRSPVSAEYPIVEAIVGLLFVALFAFAYSDPSIFPGRWLDAGGSHGYGIRPEWAWSGFPRTWPIFIVWLLLTTCLMAILLVDSKTFMIPLPLVWWPAIFGLVGHVGFALYCQFVLKNVPFHVPGWSWAIATPSDYQWPAIGAALGGTVGIGISSMLLGTGLIKRSFADYDDWEKAHLAKAKEPLPDASVPALGDAPGEPAASAEVPLDTDDQADLWIQYPHARREMLRELLYLAPAIGLALLGAALATKLAGPWTVEPMTGTNLPHVHAPLWLTVLAGVCLGYLVGGGVVWAMRIFGTLAFGKEAMGLGDVHMMAAVGACLGWIDATLAFFVAAFVGLVWNLGQIIRDGKKPLPYGPYLAVATLLVMLGKYWIEKGINAGMRFEPPLNLP